MEEGTPFARWYEQGRLSFPRDDDAADMYGKAVQVLTSAGYEHYEVSMLAGACLCGCFIHSAFFAPTTCLPKGGKYCRMLANVKGLIRNLSKLGCCIRHI